MAWLLLQRRLEEFVPYLPKARAAGCRGRLRVYQEAFLVFKGDAKAAATDIEIDPETRQRFREFQAACATAKTEDDSQRIVQRFGDTYFFYYYHAGGRPTR